MDEQTSARSIEEYDDRSEVARSNTSDEKSEPICYESSASNENREDESNSKIDERRSTEIFNVEEHVEEIERWKEDAISYRYPSPNLTARSLLMDELPAAKLSRLEVAAFSCILKECLDSLSLLAFAIDARVNDRWDEAYRSIDETYGVPEETGIIFREDTGLQPLVPTIPGKMQRDRTYAYETLKRTVEEIATRRTFQTFERTINEIVKTEEGERELEANYTFWNEQHDQLSRLFDAEKARLEEEKIEKMSMCRQRSAEVDDSIFFNGSQLGYVEKWEKARVDQQKLRAREKEKELTEQRNECEDLEKTEDIVSREVRTYLEANMREMEDEIVAWTSQCNEEIERREQESKEFQEQVLQQKSVLRELSKLRDERQSFIDHVLEEQGKLQEEEAYRRKIHAAATILQSFWRGIMVRKELGPYKDLRARLKKRKIRRTKPRKKTLLRREEKRGGKINKFEKKKLKSVAA